MKYFEIILIAWNVITFSMMGVDKYKAEHKKWRIRESVLLISAFAMGGVGTITGSKVFRHKTQKTKFKVLLPLAVILNIICFYFIMQKISLAI
ncbi:DUF1294 domain-containing protein [Clostridium aminobutyricum]|uniref:DUF1294 domain-containing protein n=1 Tax=Clostridium aminobutyricum TaxID=33953 RepID=A0A939IH77_CLOAM|nr:DUF1294 domain-containing protein [Clostridium aminobutyricum]MBN7773322.1 DUF1294 domain-containing protein [Clostridium aminobutyricum]